MKKQFKLAAITACFYTTGAAQTVFAQGIGDFESSIIQGDQIDQAILNQQQLGGQVRPDENAIDGEAGIYILNKNDIFYVGATAGFGYSENPLRTVDDIGDSFSFNAAGSTGVQTKLAEAVDFGLQVTVSGVEYFDDFAPSSRNINSSATVGTPIKNTPLYISATIFGGLNFDEDFEDGVEFIGGTAGIGAGIPIGKRTIFRPGVAVTRQWSATSDNNSTSANGTLGITHVLQPNLSISANARVTRTWFDDFFEDVTFVPRRDWQYGVTAVANYQASNNLSLGVSAGYSRRDSSFFISEFDSFDASLFVSARLRF